MCVTNMANVAFDGCKNAPGMKARFSIALVSELTTIGAAVGHAVSTITPVSTKGFYSFSGSRKDNSEASVPDPENGGYTTEVNYFVPRQSAAKAGLFTQMNSAEAFVAITEDQNNLRRIVGALDHPAKVTVEAVTTPKNGYNFKIMWESHADLPLIFTGTIPLPA